MVLSGHGDEADEVGKTLNPLDTRTSVDWPRVKEHVFNDVILNCFIVRSENLSCNFVFKPKYL